jgi:regulator of sigma E protease
MLQVTDAAGHGARQVRLGLDELGAQEMDAELIKRVGLGGAYSEPVMGEVKAGGPAAAAGLRQGDRVLRVDGVAGGRCPVAARAHPRAWSHGAGPADALALSSARPHPAWTSRPRSCATRSSVSAGSRPSSAAPEMVTVQLRGPVEGLVRGAQRTWDMSVLTLKT